MFEDTMFDAAVNTAKQAATAPVIPADRWPKGAHLHTWDHNGRGNWHMPVNGLWHHWVSDIPMPAGWDWRVPVMRPSAEEVRAQANMDAGWYARREAHARAMGYTGVAEALEDLESRRNAPAIDLEQFRPAVEKAKGACHSQGFGFYCNALLALIDGQANKPSPIVQRKLQYDDYAALQTENERQKGVLYALVAAVEQYRLSASTTNRESVHRLHSALIDARKGE